MFHNIFFCGPEIWKKTKKFVYLSCGMLEHEGNRKQQKMNF